MRSGSSDSLLSQTSGSARHRHAVPSRKPRAERLLPVPCPSALSREAPGATAKASSGPKAARESETARPAKESRSQKHTRVKIRFPTLSLHGRKRPDLIRFRCLSKKFINEIKWSVIYFKIRPRSSLVASW